MIHILGHQTWCKVNAHTLLMRLLLNWKLDPQFSESLHLSWKLQAFVTDDHASFSQKKKMIMLANITAFLICAWTAFLMIFATHQRECMLLSLETATVTELQKFGLCVVVL